MNKLFCPKCGIENQDDFKYCKNCGYSIANILGNQSNSEQKPEIENSENFYFEDDNKQRIAFKFLGVFIGMLSLLGFFLPWIDLGIDISPLLSQFGIEFSSVSGFSIPKFFSSIELITNKLKNIYPDYDGGIPTANGEKITISWNGAIILYLLPILSITITIANYLEWNILKAIAGTFYLIILCMFIYVISQFGIPLTSIMGMGLYMVIACGIYFFFDFWITLFS